MIFDPRYWRVPGFPVYFPSRLILGVVGLTDNLEPRKPMVFKINLATKNCHEGIFWATIHEPVNLANYDVE